MTYLKFSAAFCVVLGLAACDKDADLLGGGNGVANGAGNGGISSSALDPNSAAYFASEIGDTVLFPVDQSTLTAEAISTLSAQVAWLNERPQMTILVEGHADEQGTREYNLALGARRAAAVKNYFVSQGLDVTRIETVTYGKERPLEICSEEACWAKNRRATTQISGGFSS